MLKKHRVALVGLVLLICAGVILYFLKAKMEAAPPERTNAEILAEAEKMKAERLAKEEIERESQNRTRIIEFCKLEGAKPEELTFEYFLKAYFETDEHSRKQYFVVDNGQGDPNADLAPPTLMLARKNGVLIFANYDTSDGVDTGEHETLCFDETGKISKREYRWKNLSDDSDPLTEVEKPEPTFENAAALEAELNKKPL